MKHETFDLDDYITQRKENDSEFAEGFDSGDHLHPSEAAYKAMADCVDESCLI